MKTITRVAAQKNQLCDCDWLETYKRLNLVGDLMKIPWYLTVEFQLCHAKIV